MNKKNVIVVGVVMSMLMGTAVFAGDQERIDEQVAFGMKEIKRILANNSVEDVGLKSRAELDRIQVGEAIPAYRLDPAALEAYKPGQRIAPLLTPMNELYYPVTVDGQVRFVLWLYQNEGRWEFAGFGQAELGSALTGLLARHSKTDAQLKIVMQHQSQAALALVEHKGSERLFYISSHAWSFNSVIRNDLTELRQPEMMSQLKEAAREMLRQVEP